MPLQFGEDGPHVRDAGAKDGVVLAGPECGTLLHVDAHDAALKDLHTVERLHAGGLPVAEVRARTDALVALRHLVTDEGRIPDLVARINDLIALRVALLLEPLGVLVNPDADVVFLHELLDEIEVIHGLGGDAVEAHRLRELKDLPRRRLVLGDGDDAVVDRTDLVLRELGLHLSDDLGRGIVVPRVLLGQLVFLGQELAGIKLDALPARLGGLLDGLEDGEAVEGVSLAADGETVDFGLVRNRRGERGQRGQHGGGSKGE